MKPSVTIRRLVAVLGLLGTPAVAGLTGSWILFPEPPVKGEATEQVHREWIDLLGFGIDGPQVVPSPDDGGFHLTKRIDKASPLLMKACLLGTRFPEVTMHLAATGITGNSQTFYEVLLRNAAVTRHSVDGGGGTPVEILTLRFSSMQVTYHEIQVSPTTAPIVTNPPPPRGDSEGDGMPDAWEQANGLDIHLNDAAADTDGDGLSAVLEYHAGTDPQDGSSLFKATIAIDPASPGMFTMSWNSVAGRTYEIQRSPNLIQPFVTVATVVAAGETMSHGIPLAESHEFFRVRLVVP